MTHNFTKDGKESRYFLVSGNLSSAKGSIEIGGETLTQCLKMESSTSISFTLEIPATVTLYLDAGFSKNVKIDGNAYAATDGKVTVALESGSHAIGKGDAANLLLVEVRTEKTDAVLTPKGSEPRISYDRLSKSLRIESARVQRVEIVRLDGTILCHAESVRRIPMAAYPKGVYLVRAKTGEGILMRKILVE